MPGIEATSADPIGWTLPRRICRIAIAEPSSTGNRRGGACDVERALEATTWCELTTLVCADSDPAVEAEQAVPDVDLLIIKEVEGDGRSVGYVEELRRRGATMPVVVVSSLGGGERAEAVLNAGANDYVAMPFHGGEFAARLRRLAEPVIETNSRRDLAVNPNAFGVCIRGVEASLRRISYRVFMHLVSREGRWVRTEELGKTLAASFRREASNVRWHVSEIRESLGTMHWCIHGDGKLGFMFALEPCERVHCKPANESSRGRQGSGARSARPRG